VHILENVEPDLAQRLHKLHPAQSCQLLVKACDFISSRISLDAKFEELLMDYQSSASLSCSQLEALISYADIADECCFDLKDRGAEENEWLPWFQRARLATALAKASQASAWEDTADGFYELTVILDDASVIVEFINRSLSELQA